MKNTFLLLCCVSVFLLFSCQREIGFDLPTQTSSDSCQLIKAYYYENGAIDDSVTYEYKNGLVSRINYWDGYILFTYNGDNISKRKLVDTSGGSIVSSEDFYSYNAANQLSLIKHYETTSVGVTFFVDSVVLSYTGNQLSRVQGYFASLAFPGMSVDEDATYTYANKNIVKTITVKQPVSETAQYEYDAQPNYFQKVFRQPLLTEPLMVDAFYDNWPVVLSANNVKRITYSAEPARNETIDYVADVKGRLSLVKSNGETRVQYVYNCP